VKIADYAGRDGGNDETVKLAAAADRRPSNDGLVLPEPFG